MFRVCLQGYCLGGCQFVTNGNVFRISSVKISNDKKSVFLLSAKNTLVSYAVKNTDR